MLNQEPGLDHQHLGSVQLQRSTPQQPPHPHLHPPHHQVMGQYLKHKQNATN